jgi:hypothetical protein
MKLWVMIERLLNNIRKKINITILIIWLCLFIINMFIILPKGFITNQLWVIMSFNNLNYNLFYLYVSLTSMFITTIEISFIYLFYKFLIKCFK